MPRVKKSRKGSSANAKPYPDFPLFRHATGQWAKKIRGKLFYFGTDSETALKTYLDQKDDLHAGRTPRVQGDGLTVLDLCNRFLTSKKALLESGELSPRTFMEYHDACARVLDTFGKSRLVVDLAGEDFEKLRIKLATTRGPVALGNEVQRVRTLFKYAFDETLIDRPVRFGTNFKKPSRKAVRRARQEAGSRMIEADDLRKLLDAAGVPLKAMILLALNAGFGQTDIAALPLGALDLDAGWVDFPRPKTAIPRRIPLWPETVAALRDAVAARPTPKDEADAALVFVTKYGKRWVRFRMREEKDGTHKAAPVDSVGLEFTKLLRSLELKRGGLGFYALRHVFRTVADESKDQPAVNAIMGHVDETMAGHYRERISDGRLQAVVNIVRNWLWPAPQNAPTILPIRTEAG